VCASTAAAGLSVGVQDVVQLTRCTLHVAASGCSPRVLKCSAGGTCGVCCAATAPEACELSGDCRVAWVVNCLYGSQFNNLGLSLFVQRMVA